MEKDANWFESWFDSPYYHILYRHRDEEEARLFIDRLLEYLGLPGGASVLDLACGRGRHSLYLNSKGAEVTGIDLSESNIRYASTFATPSLSFYVQDMRRIFRTNYFDVVLNLFTSFGYFERDLDNFHVVESATKALKKGGYLVIDFLNSGKVLQTLREQEIQVLESITFHINRRMEEGFIVKSISFEDKGREYRFQEKVKALTLDDFRIYFEKSGLELVDTFGEYALEPFRPESSGRLIMIAKKK
jgi:SAM-dependent methyltransferase